VRAGELAVFDRRVPIVVTLPTDTLRALSLLERTHVREVPLAAVARVRSGTGPAEIHRIAQRRVTRVTAELAAGRLDDVVRAAREVVASTPPPPGLRVEVGGENEEVRRSFRALGLAFALAVLLVYMILAAEFESLVHPLTVLLSVPLALVGAAVALRVTGAGLNAVSLIGLVVLVGIVDNDAVVKVDFINRMRCDGMPVRKAILAAGRARFRPIVINTVTALLGLLPMALGIGPGAAFQAPLAIAVFGGLLSATALTLIVIPVAYSLTEDARQWLQLRARAVRSLVAHATGSRVVEAPATAAASAAPDLC
jgi:HAE1 family hydrophobic/amphiphilic exporter-1